jgi:hypothetical protein
MTQKLKALKDALQASESEGAKVSLDFLTGFSGAKLLGALQRITALCDHNEVYCEIGVFQGMSLVSVAAANPATTCIGIDNYAFFDPDGKNKSIVCERIGRANCDNVTLLEVGYEDCSEMLQRHLAEKKIGLLFIDGPHDYRSQLMCLMLFEKFLSDKAVVIVDDCNYEHVRQANSDFLVTHSNYALAWEKYTGKHPDNMTPAELSAARAGWWNGVNVICRDDQREWPRTLPRTGSERTLYENDHLVHPMRYAEAAPEALRFASALYPLRIRTAFRKLLSLRRRIQSLGDRRAWYDGMNMRGM